MGDHFVAGRGARGVPVEDSADKRAGVLVGGQANVVAEVVTGLIIEGQAAEVGQAERDGLADGLVSHARARPVSAGHGR